MADEKGKTPQDNNKGVVAKSGLDSFYTAINKILAEDDFGEDKPKLDQWLNELTDLHREIIFENAGKVSLDNLVRIIRTIIAEGTEVARIDRAQKAGMLKPVYNPAVFMNLMCEYGLRSRENAGRIENWINGLDPIMADFFRSRISALETQIARRVLGYLAGCANDTARTLTAINHKLLPNT